MRVLSLALLFSPLFFFVFNRVEASHKPISDSVMAYAIKQLFENAGGIEAAQLLFEVAEEENQDYFETEEDLRLLFKAAGIDYDKARKAFRGMGSTFKLFNSGITITAAVKLVKEAERAGVDVKSPSLIMLHAFKARGEKLAKADTLLILRGLRQGEFLNHHLGERNNLAFFGEELNWHLIFEKVIVGGGVEVLEVTSPSKNWMGTE